MKGTCVPCGSRQEDLLTHLEKWHPKLFGFAKFARRDDGEPVVLASRDVHVQTLDLNRIQNLAAAALPHWDAVEFEVWSNSGVADDGERDVYDLMKALDPATVLLLVNVANGNIP